MYNVGCVFFSGARSNTSRPYERAGRGRDDISTRCDMTTATTRQDQTMFSAASHPCAGHRQEAQPARGGTATHNTRQHHTHAPRNSPFVQAQGVQQGAAQTRTTHPQTQAGCKRRQLCWCRRCQHARPAGTRAHSAWHAARSCRRGADASTPVQTCATGRDEWGNQRVA